MKKEEDYTQPIYDVDAEVDEHRRADGGSSAPAVARSPQEEELQSIENELQDIDPDDSDDEETRKLNSATV